MINKLVANIKKTNAPIVVGLDPMLNYIPEHVQKKAFAEFGETLEGAAEAIWQFNKEIVDKTYDLIPAVKPQIAMYEQFGIPGLVAFKKTVDYCKEKGHVPGIIAKIENAEAVENLEEIVQTADGVMVARGDLADEFPFARVPQIQRMIIELCRDYAKPVIVATQMLGSMVNNIKPTRAEISDVANAVYQSTSATMTSEETAKSIDPVNTIETMVEIIETAEEEFISDGSMFDEEDKDSDDFINQQLVVSSLNTLSSSIGVDSIVVLTKSGRMAEIISNERPEYPIFALTESKAASLREKALVYFKKPVRVVTVSDLIDEDYVGDIFIDDIEEVCSTLLCRQLKDFNPNIELNLRAVTITEE